MDALLSIVGKLPSRGDFLRENLSPVARQVDHWMEAAFARCVQAGGEFPKTLRVLSHTDEGWAVSAFVPSQDAVGREYPLGVILPVNTEPMAATLVVAAGPFLSGSLDWLSAADRLEEEQVRRGLFALAGFAFDYEMAESICRRAGNEGVALMERRLFTDHNSSFYAYQTLIRAAELASKGQKLVLDCPITVDIDQFFWLTALAALGHPRPSILWVEEPTPRMLVALTALPEGVLSVLATDSRDPDWLWPLRTRHEVARTSAADLFGSELTPKSGESILAFAERLSHQRTC